MVEESKDLYQILGVARDAEEDVIKKAYRKLARQHHPDVNPGDAQAEERFKEISKAWSVLSDPERRRDYDAFGEIALEAGFDRDKARQAREAFGARFGQSDPGAFAGEDFSYGGLDDLLSEFFGRGQAARSGAEAPGWALRGPDLDAELELDFVEAATGTEKRLGIARPTAGGSMRTEHVTVRIPPGVAEGGRIRVPGKGGEGIGGGPPGDLHARIRVRPHPFFRRDGRDILLDVPISVREAVLGSKVEVPTLDGRATVTIPPGTDGGSRLRLRGKGVAGPGGQAPGDLYAIVRIRVPKVEGDVPTDLQEAVEALDGHTPEDLRKEFGS